ncbi:unnamed protein product [Trypanosoma congolense IL3000]|uniref:WGS project CAEQ00000000 data, annotated contig 1871 n=1 Tax=Trypanosoma congolense (strain IL3000) TaxID=1068625 RepID=F9W9K7_TRYCI|nr:unnamed protein product [Trypanosoma congolense IL3000]
MTEHLRRELADPQRREKALAEDKHPQIACTTSAAMLGRSSLYYTSPNACNNFVAVAANGGASASSTGRISKHLASVGGVGAGRRASAAGRQPLPTAASAVGYAAVPPAASSVSFKRTPSSMAARLVPAEPPASLPRRYPSSSVRGVGVSQSRTAVGTAQLRTRLPFASSESSTNAAVCEGGVQSALSTESYRGVRVSAMVVSPRGATMIPRGVGSSQAVAPASSRFPLVPISPRMPAISSSRVPLGAIRRGGDSHDGIRTERCSIGPSSLSVSACTAVVRSERPVASAAVAPGAAKPFAAATARVTSTASSKVAFNAKLTTTTSMAPVRAVDRSINKAVSTRATGGTVTGRVFSVPVAAYRTLVTEKRNDELVPRKLSFDDESLPSEGGDSGGPGCDPQPSDDKTVALPVECEGTSSTAPVQTQRERLRAISTPAQLRVRWPETGSIPAPAASAAVCREGTDGDCDGKGDASNSLKDTMTEASGSPKDEGTLANGGVGEENPVRKRPNMLQKQCYVGSPVGDSGQKPFIRHSVRGVDSGRAKLSVMPSLATLRDHMFYSALRPSYDMWSGRSNRPTTQVKISRCNSTGSLRSQQGEADSVVRRRNLDSETIRSCSINTASCRGIATVTSSLLPPPAVSARFERASQHPIHPASQRLRSCVDSPLSDDVVTSNTSISRSTNIPTDRFKVSTATSADGRLTRFRSVGSRLPTVPEVRGPPFTPVKPVSCTVPSGRRASDSLAGTSRLRSSRSLPNECGQPCRSGRRGGEVGTAASPFQSPGGTGSQRSKYLRCPGRRDFYNCTTATSPSVRAATASPRRLRLEDTKVACHSGEDMASDDGANKPASVLLRLRNVLEQRSRKVRESKQEHEKSVSVDGSRIDRGSSQINTEQKQQGQQQQQRLYNIGSGSGSGSGGGRCGVSSSDTPGDMTERAEKSIERCNEDASPSFCGVHRGDGQRWIQPQHDKSYELDRRVAYGSIRRTREVVGEAAPFFGGNNRVSVGAGVATNNRVNSIQAATVSRRLRERADLGITGYEADDSDESDWDGEDSWWFFDYYWSGPPVVVPPPPFVPPLNLDHLRVENDVTALTKYAIPLPTAVSLCDGDPLMFEFSSPTAVATDSSGRNSSTQLLHDAAHLPVDCADGSRRRNVCIKLLLLEAAERRMRRLQVQEEAEDRKDLMQLMARRHGR